MEVNKYKGIAVFLHGSLAAGITIPIEDVKAAIAGETVFCLLEEHFGLNPVFRCSEDQRRAMGQFFKKAFEDRNFFLEMLAEGSGLELLMRYFMDGYNKTLDLVDWDVTLN